jgi:adenosylcobinamide amidohydrolase
MRRGYLKASGRRAASLARALRIAPLMLLATALPMARAQAPADEVDTALIVSVDVSNSVDDARYKLQMEGIARALEDPSVIQAIIGGAKGGILFSMITWADQAKVNLPWTHITNAEEAKAAAMRVRALPRQGGEFTCMSRMMGFVSDKIVPQIPAKAAKVVLDVSGDGRDNCNEPEPVEKVRDELVSYGVTVNGLPILEGNEGEGEGPGGVPTQSYLPAAPGDSTGTPLEDWYRDHVKGGPGSFVLPANGYADFGRAIRQKFVLEVSSLFGDAR